MFIVLIACQLPKYIIIPIESVSCDSLLNPIAVRITISNIIVQLFKKKCPPTSSATVSGRDPVAFNESNLRSRVCLFVATRKDGTPFNATSVTDEDIIKICIKMGHTHPLCVLCYSSNRIGSSVLH